jgi:hypothetical protein
MDRFRQYLRTMIGPEENTLEFPPLGIMNPMGKEHVTALLDAFLALDADGIAKRALAEASAQLANDSGDFKVALVVVDDLMGGWTNRYDYEFTLRFGQGPMPRDGSRPKWLKDYWLTGVLWSSEPGQRARGARSSVDSRLPGDVRAAQRPGPQPPRHAHSRGTRHDGGGLHRTGT